MQLKYKIDSLVQISKFLQNYLENRRDEYPALSEKLDEIIAKSEQANSWFTKEFQNYALQYWANHLNHSDLEQWLSHYNFHTKDKTIGLILAGNIPMVGFHDVLCVLLSGNKALIKLSTKDRFLIPFFLEFWQDLCEKLDFEYIERLENFDAVIATGSNNTARYFEYYFKDKPHIIRNNRTSVALLDHTETDKELSGLAEDIFTYFGLGCRNVTQLFVPKDYDLDLLFKAFYPYQNLAQHHKYLNSYEYYRAIYMLNKDKFWDNNFVLLLHSDKLFAPVATVNFWEYESKEEVRSWMQTKANDIQAVVGHEKLISNAIPFGSAQNPPLDNYADGVDVMTFIEGLK